MDLLVIPEVSLPRGMGEQGSWKPKRVPGRPLTAEVSCPECGKHSSMADHSIASTGEVTPDVMCPHGLCMWHAQVQLLGWVPDIAPEPSPTPSTRNIYKGGIPL